MSDMRSDDEIRDDVEARMHVSGDDDAWELAERLADDVEPLLDCAVAAEAEVERFRRPCEACGFKPSTHDHDRDCPRLPALAVGPQEPYVARLEADNTRLRERVRKVEALASEARQITWPSAVGYPSSWDLDPAAVLALLGGTDA